LRLAFIGTARLPVYAMASRARVVGAATSPAR
jgi:hypothetical protein